MRGKVRQLFVIRIACLGVFALLALVLGVIAHEEHISIALIGIKLCDIFGESLSEAIAAIEE
jgi:hypothetical protein